MSPSPGAATAGATTILPEALVQQYARSLVGKAGSSAARTLILRARPVWDGLDELTVVDQDRSITVHVRACVSPLAVRDAMRTAGSEHLLVITDQSDADLGLGILSHCYDQRVITPSMWEAVKGSFAAREVDPHLARISWAAEALVTCAPASGWPVAPTAVLTRDHALRHLTAELLGLPASDLDPSAILDWSLASRGTALDAQPAAVREGIVNWVGQSIGPVAALSLQCSMQGHSVDAVSIGLAADVLWADDPAVGVPSRPAPAEVIAARARLETWTGVRDLDAVVARAFADAARGATQRMASRRDPAHALVMQRATAMFDSLGYPQGAGASTVLPAGYQARLANLARGIREYLASSCGWGQLAAVEAAFADFLRHDLAGPDRSSRIARMAVRLARWLAVPEPDAPTNLHTALLRQAREDAFVDWAAADVWVGSTDPEVAEAAAGLFSAVRARRDVHDAQFATLLADATARGVLPDALVPVESVIATILQPLADAARLLIVVVDGMSTAVAAELADETLRAGWYEAVPEADPQRTATLAALPTLTRYSRTSLLTGRLAAGAQAEEKAGFTALTGGQVFHKADLVGDAGQALPGPVLAALRSEVGMVAAVLNTVDDTLAKADPGGTDWTVSSIQHLQPLLDEAARSGRTVVLISDHGHVVERGGQARGIDGAEARWRNPSTGPLDASNEVSLAGPRVLADGGTIIAAVQESVRYGTKQAGYHGGASAAEAVIPIIVLSRNPDDLRAAGWVPAIPQAPSWWHDQLPGLPSHVRSAPAGGTPSGNGGRRAGTPPGQGAFEIDIPVAPVDEPLASLVEAVLSSPIYQAQRARYGARAISDEVVRGALTLLIAQGGRAHRDTVAAAAGIAQLRWEGAVSNLRRQLNVEGYSVFSIDVDEVTVLLDIPLLRQQFVDGAAAPADRSDRS
ncbi:MAG: BREX-2 system phosphatase PglZ [Actinomycetales bacterium]|nr:BREX-2 system phosphatase PglZ [Actinomycetales bacterium]